MVAIGISSVVGAPGVSTFSLFAAAGSTAAGADSVLLEISPSGGVIGQLYELEGKSGLQSYLNDYMSNPEVSWRDYIQNLPGGLACLTAPQSVVMSTGLIPSLQQSGLLERLADDPDILVICDLGRLYSGSPTMELLASLSALLVMSKPIKSDLILTGGFMNEAVGVPWQWLLSGQSPWPLKEVEILSGSPVMLEVPDDPDAIKAFNQGKDKKFRHSLLARTARSFAESLLKQFPFTAQSPQGSAAHTPQGSAAHTPQGLK